MFASTAGLLAGWSAAGSLGVLDDPLRMAVVYLLVTVAVVASWNQRSFRPSLAWVAVAIWLIPLVLAAAPVPTLLLVSATLGILATDLDGSDRATLRTVGLALLLFAGYRWGCESVAGLWWLSDQLGQAIGRLGGWLVDRPLRVGASFAGLDYLVVMLALFVLVLLQVRRQVLQAVVAGLAIFAAHGVYLAILAWAWDLAQWLPEHPDPTFDHPYIPPPWDWSRAAASWLPWNLPMLGAVLHGALAAMLLGSAPWPCRQKGSVEKRGQESFAASGPESASQKKLPTLFSSFLPTRWRALLQVGGYCAAAVLPWVASYTPGGRDLQGIRLLANAQGDLDWQLPQHDHYGRDSAGTFGMLPALVASLGGRLDVSPDLSAEQLDQTDVLLLLHPPASMGQAMIQRVCDFVRQGGSLLVVGQPGALDGTAPDGVNQALAPTRMRVRRDVAFSACDRWEAAGQRIHHPARSRQRNRESLLGDGGSSIELGWAAWPLIVGRWGWSDPGSDSLISSIARCEVGEHLGDLVLAAEQRWGRGTVVVLGNDRPLTNEGLVHGHQLVIPLLDYLAHRPSSPNTMWRQAVSLALILLLVLGAICSRRPLDASAMVLVWVAMAAVVQLAAIPADAAAPDGRRLASDSAGAVRGLAYIDASHLEPYSDSDWVYDGINGLALNLMRNGYLTLSLPDWSASRLMNADLLVSVAPARRFSKAQRQQVGEFVVQGGMLVCTVGAEQALASHDLLRDYGIRVPTSPVPTGGAAYEPAPMGHVRSLYLDASKYELGDYRVGVVLHAAWPVESDGQVAEVLVRGTQERAVVVCRTHGAGKVVVMGDSAFALNKNLEYIGGEPFNGRHENAHFWRWFISRLTPGPEWVPPLEEPEVGTETQQESPP